jgi:hypothetical protein
MISKVSVKPEAEALFAVVKFFFFAIATHFFIIFIINIEI